jgi:hypothetical protein
VDEILFRALVERVGGYLDGIDRLAASQSCQFSEAGRELRRLAGAWRSLLGQHAPVSHGRRCSGCRGSPAMCSVWRAAGAWFLRA